MESPSYDPFYFQPSCTSLYSFTDDHIWLYPIGDGTYYAGVTDWYLSAILGVVAHGNPLERPLWRAEQPHERLMDLNEYRAYVQQLEEKEDFSSILEYGVQPGSLIK